MEKSDHRPICKFYRQGYCKYQNKCFNYHPPKNQKVCFEFKTHGFCKYGSNCHFSHMIHSNLSHQSEKEIRKAYLSNEKEEKQITIKNLPISEIIKSNESKKNMSEPQVETNKQEIEISKQKLFLDFSKTELGQEILEKNKDLWGTEISYFDYLKTIKNEKDLEICQIQRKYKSSFMWIITNQETQPDIKSFQIRHTPTIKREFLELEFEIEEGYLWFEFILNMKEYPANDSLKITLINNSIPNFFKKAFCLLFKKIFNETKSIFKTLRNIDNSFDKICSQIFNKKNQSSIELWTQEQQSALENAILKFRSITNADEKWKMIANEVPDKDHESCLKRFKECREKALLAKKEEKIEKESSSEYEEESEEDDDEDDNEKENEKDNEEINEIHSEDENEEENIIETKALTLENEFNVFLNLNIKVNELIIKEIGVINLEEVIFLVKCQKCKDEVEKKLTLHKDFPDYLYNDVLCANCNTSGIILLKKAFMHSSSNVLGKAGSNSWDILDILTVNLRLVCEICSHAKIYEKYMVGSKLNYNCNSCFKEVIFCYTSYSLTFEEYSEAQKKNFNKGNKTQTKEESKTNKIKKVL